MLTPCIGCGKPLRVGTRGRCSRCRGEHRKYRSSSAWTRQSRQARAGAVCAKCGAAGKLQAHHASARLADDLERAKVGEVVVLCLPCHAAEHRP